mmetsp:Transcript_37195/g.66378  ORF Transcript_37195/g.66378 Transcript_37195/m.66378 type:complete len:383 (-) Transcript_37195:817-1965(-)
MKKQQGRVVAAEDDDDDDEPIVVSDYRKADHQRGPGPVAVVDALTGQVVAAEMVAEHMRITTLDPRWKEQQVKEKEKLSTTNLAPDADMSKVLGRFAARRSDIFGDVEGQVGQDVSELQGPAKSPSVGADRSINTGHSLVRPGPGPGPGTGAGGKAASSSAVAMKMALGNAPHVSWKGQRLPAVSPMHSPGSSAAPLTHNLQPLLQSPHPDALHAVSATINPLCPGLHLFHGPLLGAQAMPAHSTFAAPVPPVGPADAGTFGSTNQLSAPAHCPTSVRLSAAKAPAEPPAKRPKMGLQITELVVKVPCIEGSEYALHGQCLSIKLPGAASMGEVKHRVQEVLGLPTTKFQLRDAATGAFLKDTQPCTRQLELVLRERGGRRK